MKTLVVLIVVVVLGGGIYYYGFMGKGGHESLQSAAGNNPCSHTVTYSEYNDAMQRVQASANIQDDPQDAMVVDCYLSQSGSAQQQ